MNGISDEQVKYWKYSSVISGVIGISFLIGIIFNLIITTQTLLPTTTVSSSIAEWAFDISYFFKISPNLMFSTLLTMPYILFSILFVLAGTLASKGKLVGALMALILSSIVIVSVILLLFYLPLSYSPEVLILLLFTVLGSPQFLLSMINIYYSLKAIKSRINKRAMSLPAFSSCSLQYAVAIILAILGIEMIIVTIPTFIAILEYGIVRNPQLTNLLFVIIAADISLPTSFILLHISVNHIFNHEEEISKKRVFLCIGLTIVLLLIIAYTFPIFGFAVGVSTIPFLVASLVFAMLIQPPESVEQMGSRAIVSTMDFLATKKEDHEHMAPGFKYCRFCGSKIPNDSIYCEYCGKKLRE